jgi:hypothetical protein
MGFFSLDTGQARTKAELRRKHELRCEGVAPMPKGKHAFDVDSWALRPHTGQAARDAYRRAVAAGKVEPAPDRSLFTAAGKLFAP